MGSPANGFVQQEETGKKASRKNVPDLCQQRQGRRIHLQTRPVYLVYSEKYQSKVAALNRERQLKHWSYGKKEALILGNRARLKYLSKQRSNNPK